MQCERRLNNLEGNVTSVEFDFIQVAMQSTRALGAIYQGRRREFCAHELGFDKQGQEKVLVYQYAGTSSKGDIAALPSKDRWRCLFVADLSDLVAIEYPWQTGPNRGAGNTCMDQTIEIVYPPP